MAGFELTLYGRIWVTPKELEADGIIVRKDMSDLVLHNDEQLLRWPFRLGTSYEVALFHSSF
jgi:hypothetical protein